MYRLSPTLVSIVCLSTVMPAFARVTECGDEHFVAGERTLPTHDEALTQCRAEEVAMTDPATGSYETERSCYDVTPPGTHGAWRHGRVAVDVIERRSGDAYTFEALWMCKPVRD